MKFPRFHFKVYRTFSEFRDKSWLTVEAGRFWTIEVTREMVELWNFKEAMKHGVKVFQTPEFIKYLKQGEVIPRCYGFAYYDFNRDCSGYCIIPLNLIYAACRWVKWSVLWNIKSDWPRWLMQHELRIYTLGKKDGFEAGRFSRHVVREAMDILRGEGHEVKSHNDPES